MEPEALSVEPEESTEEPGEPEESTPRPVLSGELSVDVLRELFRNLLAWRSLYTSEGIDTLRYEGGSICLWDLEYLYAASQMTHPPILPIRQRQAIRLCLVFNFSEQMAAEKMKIDDTNPVAMYATSGLEELIHKYRYGLLPSRKRVAAAELQKRNRKELIVPPLTVLGSANWVDPYVCM